LTVWGRDSGTFSFLLVVISILSRKRAVMKERGSADKPRSQVHERERERERRAHEDPWPWTPSRH